MNTTKEKLFYIAVTDQPDSYNRKYSEIILKLLKSSVRINQYYNIEVHYQNFRDANLDESLWLALLEDEYAGYIILLDCLDKSINANVMFEFGAVMAQGKPFAIISQYHDKFPFDIEHLNIDFIDKKVMMVIQKNIENGVNQIVDQLKCSDNELESIIDDMVRSVEGKLQNRSGFVHNNIKTYNMIYNELVEIKKMINAEYIDGEDNAFQELTKAVYSVKSSLRTSRFANQSIVKKPTDMQQEFMKALYDVSKRNSVKNNFERIICNNSPLKWFDIQNILLNGSNDLIVYVRKEEYSIHFELVIIDEEIAFIHFYQSDRVGQENDREMDPDFDTPVIEKINSTVKIKGPICRKLANIFNRLHHRDVENREMKELSRTLLGIPKSNKLNADEKKRGYFRIKDIEEAMGENMKEPDMYDEDGKNRRKKLIIEYFKTVFQRWWLEEGDKVNMLVGIALLEMKHDFISRMRYDEFITPKEYTLATVKFEKYQKLLKEEE